MTYSKCAVAFMEENETTTLNIFILGSVHVGCTSVQEENTLYATAVGRELFKKLPSAIWDSIPRLSLSVGTTHELKTSLPDKISCLPLICQTLHDHEMK